MKTATLAKMDYPHGMIPFSPLESAESQTRLGDQNKTGTIRRGPWSPEEDRRLMEIILLYGPLNWVRISVLLVSRSPKQCRERYHQNLKPLLNRNPINTEEGLLIEKLVLQHGKKWAEIARHLPGRSDNAIKNWWNGGANRRRRALQISCSDDSGQYTGGSTSSAASNSSGTLGSGAFSAGSSISAGAPSSSIRGLLNRSLSGATTSTLALPGPPDGSWRRRLTGFVALGASTGNKTELMSMPPVPILHEGGNLGAPPMAYHQNPDIAFNTSMFGNPMPPIGTQSAPHVKLDAGLVDTQRVNYRYVSVPQLLMSHFVLQSPADAPISSISSLGSQPILYNASRNSSVGHEHGPMYAPYMSPYSLMPPNSTMSTVLSTQNLRRPLALPSANIVTPGSSTLCYPGNLPFPLSGKEPDSAKAQSPLRTSASAINLSTANESGGVEVASSPTIPKTNTSNTVEDEKPSLESEEKKMCVSNLIN